jgi:DNA-directed RNA polymerases I, II, and III subunit RPABC2
MSDYEDYEDYEDNELEIDMENDDDFEDVENIEEDNIEEYNIKEDNIEENDNNDFKFINESIILNSENINTTKYLTIYEKAGIIGQRSEELHEQYKKGEFMPLVDINKDMINEYDEIDFIKVAEKELVDKKIPYYIRRILPNNKYVIVDIKELILKERY